MCAPSSSRARPTGFARKARPAECDPRAIYSRGEPEEVSQVSVTGGQRPQCNQRPPPPAKEGGRGTQSSTVCPASDFTTHVFTIPLVLPRVPPQPGSPRTRIAVGWFSERLLIRAVVGALGTSRNLRVLRLLDFRREQWRSIDRA